MNGRIHQYFTNDHHRLDALLEAATKNIENIDEVLYHQFRTGLLKHIKMEEKILFPAAQKANNNTPLPIAAKLRLDHGALTALMVVVPSKNVIKVIKHVMELHDILEEEEGGMYDLCERLTEDQTDQIIAALDLASEVPVHPFNPADYVLDVAKRCLTRAGFDYDSIVAE